MKQIFLRKFICYESLVDIEVSNKLKHLIIDRSYSLGRSDVNTNVNTMTPINPLFYHEKTGENMVVKNEIIKEVF